MNESKENQNERPSTPAPRAQSALPGETKKPKESKATKSASPLHLIALTVLLVSAAWFWTSERLPQGVSVQGGAPERIDPMREEVFLPAPHLNEEESSNSNLAANPPIESGKNEPIKPTVTQQDPATLLFGVVSRIRDSREEK